jgi:hypothetical protein
LVRTSIVLLALFVPCLTLAAQMPADVPQTAAPPPSATLQPALEVLNTALAETRLDKWKGSVTIKSESDANLASIQRDVTQTLPPLLASADAAPDSAARTLPLYRNLEALYDVLLRVDSASHLSAPADQVSALDQALARLETSRKSLGDQLQLNAAAQEKQVIHLQAALKAVPPPPAAAPAPVPLKCPSPSVKKKAPAKPKPATPTGQSSTTKSQ